MIGAAIAIDSGGEVRGLSRLQFGQSIRDQVFVGAPTLRIRLGDNHRSAELVSENEGAIEREIRRVRTDLAFLSGDRGGPNHKDEMNSLRTRLRELDAELKEVKDHG